MAASGGAAIWSISMVALTLLVILGLGVFAWTTFVELQPPRAVRNSMLTVLLLITLLEVYLYAAGLASCRWLNFLFVAFLCNFWGLFDVLRTFPRIRDLDSWQSAKLTVLLMLKTFAYCLCLAYNSSRAVLFMITTFTNVWLLPIMFLVALPYGFEVTEGPRLDEPHTEDSSSAGAPADSYRCFSRDNAVASHHKPNLPQSGSHAPAGQSGPGKRRLHEALPFAVPEVAIRSQ
ncbi:hypothetical protein FOZ60_008320 [Perkinsus olseni]|uniref:Uncharacterized protein n=1 Tax=Perkinsus olseni TaxID=32597 RepID=A0A7J6NKL2_PEROL|nr:hypothetical protein FOZ60_008320 [Perkinsus olseni]